MYELDWSNDTGLEEACEGDGGNERVAASRHIKRMALLRWEEHCLECIVPECFQSCKLYVSRSDGSCARFVGGIVPNKKYGGVLGWGADIEFRAWAKLETGMFLYPVSPGVHRFLNRMDKVLSRGCKWIFELMPRAAAYGVHWRYTAVKNRMLSLISRLRSGKFDDFVMECYSLNDEPVQLVMEHRYQSVVQYRNSFCIRPGHNIHIVPIEKLEPLYWGRKSRLAIYPENNAEVRVVFSCLDIVKWDGKYRDSIPKSKSQAAVPAAKVKCVAWDLDNTLWEGILIEDGAEKLAVRQEAVTAIEELDRRGIIQTIVSKNDHEQAWQVVEDMGLAEYFIYPAINWASKSSNIVQISERLNIGIDSIALVDDSAFERDEVQHGHPEIRVYSEDEIGGLVMRDEFDSPVTEMSKKRRASYQNQVQREHASEIFSGDHFDFLRSCKMEMEVFVPRDESHVARCWELIQRTNQLNLSGRTYSSEEFDNLRNSEGVVCTAFKCADKFGDYGIVGFASVDEREEPVKLVDFVISCRVAQKRIECAFIKWLTDRERKLGHKGLEVRLVKSNRNGPLQKVFDELPFKKVEENKEIRLMNLSLELPLEDEGVVRVRETAD